MSTMAIASGGLRSSLNPNAPLFIPAALRQVEDFSPEWYELVKTSTWFREHWFSQHQEQDTFDGYEDDDDVVNMLPDSFDLGIDDELSNFGGLEEAIFHQADGCVGDYAPKERLRTGLEMDANAIMKSLNLKSPKHYRAKSLADAARYMEKPVPAVSPKPSPRHIIQQPR